MFRPLLALTAALAAAPAAGAVYSATPVAAPAGAQVVARDVVWACGSESCAGVTNNGRPIVVCQALAKKTGRIASFSVDGRAFAAAELERCNASARSDTSAVATGR